MSGPHSDMLMILLIVTGLLLVFAYGTILFRRRRENYLRMRTSSGTGMTDLLLDSLASLSEVTDVDDLVRLALNTANKFAGTTVGVLGERSLAAFTLTVYTLENGNVVRRTEEIRFESKSDLSGPPDPLDAIWDTSADELAAVVSAGTDCAQKISRFLQNVFHSHRIGAVRPQIDDTSRFIVFDHDSPDFERMPRAFVVAFIHRLYSAATYSRLLEITTKRTQELERLYHNPIYGLLTISNDGTILSANRTASAALHDDNMERKNICDFVDPAEVGLIRSMIQESHRAERATPLSMLVNIAGVDATTNKFEFTISYDATTGTHFVALREAGASAESPDDKTFQITMQQIEKIASALTHDLNNVIGTTLGYASLLKRSLPPDSKERQYAEIVEKSSRQTADLVKKFLGFTSLDLKTVRRIDLNAFVAEAVDRFKSERRESFVIKLGPHEKEIPVSASTFQLAIVIDTVLENAAEATDSGGTISIATRILEPKHGGTGERDCVIEISDAGSGMAPSVRRRIFEPFFTTKPPRKFKGFGLGAAASIMRHHKGSITVESTPGAGTTVRLQLPCSDEALSTSESTSSTSSVEAGRKRVLIVDDEEDVRRLGVDILTENGFEVYTAANGREALDRLEDRAPIDLVVLDMIMPVMGGRDACIKIKKQPHPPKVLICTGYSQLAELEEVLKSYADGLIQKPYTTGELLEGVRKILKT